jgi:hypothetical protein
MEQVSYIITPSGNINVFISGRPFYVEADDPRHASVVELIEDENVDIQRLQDLLNPAPAIASKFGKYITINNGNLFFNGNIVKNSLAQRILDFVSQGLPVKALCRFMENLMENPSATSVQELFDFLEAKGLPIDNDGYVHAYKAVRFNFRDKYSGTISNEIGEVVECPRNQVDDDRERECSFGFHVGAMSYINWFANSGDKILLVRFNPKDAVSVPKDHSYTKLRVCRYEVLSEIDHELCDNYVDYGGNDYDGEDDDDYIDPNYECYEDEDDIDYDELEADEYNLGYSNGVSDAADDVAAGAEYGDKASEDNSSHYCVGYTVGYRDGWDESTAKLGDDDGYVAGYASIAKPDQVVAPSRHFNLPYKDAFKKGFEAGRAAALRR